MTVELQQQVLYGETVRFTCQARGKPTPSVMWLHNARPLSPSPRHRLTSRMLRISSVGPQDDGLYQCMAENGVGSSQASARLITLSTGKSDSCCFVRGLILSFRSLVTSSCVSFLSRESFQGKVAALSPAQPRQGAERAATCEAWGHWCHVAS